MLLTSERWLRPILSPSVPSPDHSSFTRRVLLAGATAEAYAEVARLARVPFDAPRQLLGPADAKQSK
jgi:hypothetical protein